MASPEKSRSYENADQYPDQSHESPVVPVSNESLGAVSEGIVMTGRVSEVMSENVSENQGDGGGAKGDDGAVVVDDAASAVEAMKARILSGAPTEKVMVEQIEREIKKEIKYLHKRAMKMMRTPGKMSYFEMANALKKIRELRGILASLVKASVDKVKELWLKFVHGM